MGWYSHCLDWLRITLNNPEVFLMADEFFAA